MFGKQSRKIYRRFVVQIKGRDSLAWQESAFFDNQQEAEKFAEDLVLRNAKVSLARIFDQKLMKPTRVISSQEPRPPTKPMMGW